LHPASETGIDGERGKARERGRKREERYRRKERKGSKRWDNPVSGQRHQSETTEDERDETAHGGKGVVMKLRERKRNEARQEMGGRDT